jgi:anti-sigma factor RsiW
MPGLRQAIRELTAEERHGLTDHPTPNELVDYHAGDLTPDERERLQDHLTLCPACVQALLALDTFPDPQALRPDERLPEDAITAEWERFQERTGEIRRPPPPPRRTRRPSLAPWALAASLFVAVLGLTTELARLRVRVDALSRPRAGVEIVTLFPRGESVERSGGPEAVAPPAWADRLVLVLDAPAVRQYPSYEAAIQAEGGAEVWRGGGLNRSPEGTLALEVPRPLLPAGSYRIHLFGTEPAGPVALTDFELRLAG